MNFLPDIDEDGTIKDYDQVPRRYTPPGHVTGFAKDFTAPVHKDEFGTKKKFIDDKPTMDDMHECVPNDELQCITCGREMPV